MKVHAEVDEIKVLASNCRKPAIACIGLKF
jgi:hypothetical protein